MGWVRGATVTDQTERTVAFTRTVHAPIEMVFAAFTDAEHLARWWGPEGYSVGAISVEARPGGAIAILMRAPDASETPVEGVFETIDPPHHVKMVTTATSDAQQPILEAVTSVDLRTAGDQTELSLHAHGRALAPEAAPMLAGMQEGWSQTLDRLERYLEEAGGVDSLKMHHDA